MIKLAKGSNVALGSMYDWKWTWEKCATFGSHEIEELNTDAASDS